MKPHSLIVATIIILFTLIIEVFAVPASIKSKVKGFKQFSGFLNFYWDNHTGKIWLEIDKWETEFLYVSFLAHGVGSNDIGLDRGQIGNTKVVKFERHGPKILNRGPRHGMSRWPCHGTFLFRKRGGVNVTKRSQMVDLRGSTGARVEVRTQLIVGHFQRKLVEKSFLRQGIWG